MQIVPGASGVIKPIHMLTESVWAFTAFMLPGTINTNIIRIIILKHVLLIVLLIAILPFSLKNIHSELNMENLHLSLI